MLVQTYLIRLLKNNDQEKRSGIKIRQKFLIQCFKGEKWIIPEATKFQMNYSRSCEIPKCIIKLMACEKKKEAAIIWTTFQVQ